MHQNCLQTCAARSNFSQVQPEAPGFIKFFKIPKDALDGKKTDSDTTKLNEKTSRMVFYVKPYGMRSFLFHKWHSYDITIFVTGRWLCLIACSSPTFMNF